MAIIQTFTGKGSALTYAEIDANFDNINDETEANSVTLSGATSADSLNTLVKRDGLGNIEVNALNVVDKPITRTNLGLGSVATQGDGDKGDIVVSGSGSNWTIDNNIIERLVPVGAVEFFARNTPPSGWLKANGALVSRTTYSDLFSAIGTTFGAGDGSTTFALPDLRGEFPRGWDDGRGVDTGRVFGSFQVDMFKSHTHTAQEQSSPLWAASGGSSQRSAPGETSATGGTETRPRNIALLACIKY